MHETSYKVKLSSIYNFRIVEAIVKNNVTLVLIISANDLFAGFVNLKTNSEFIQILHVGKISSSTATFWQNSFLTIRYVGKNVSLCILEYGNKHFDCQVLENDVKEIRSIKIFDDEIFIFTLNKIYRHTISETISSLTDMIIPEIITTSSKLKQLRKTIARTNLTTFAELVYKSPCQITSDFFDGPVECFVTSVKFNPFEKCQNICWIGNIDETAVSFS